MTFASQRIVSRSGIGGFRTAPATFYGDSLTTGIGPPGAATMTFFTVLRPNSPAAVPSSGFFGLFGRHSLGIGASGWLHYYGVSLWRAIVANGAGANIVHTVFTSSFPIVGRAVVMITVLGADLMTSWSNVGGIVGPTAVVGYTPSTAARRITIGNDSDLTHPARGSDFFDCGMLQGYSAVASYNDPLYGAGIAGFGAQIIADCEQGRAITWPRVAAPGSDWYWTAQDIASPFGLPTWVDRYSSVALPRLGLPSSSVVQPRF